MARAAMTAADARPLGEPGSLRRCSSALSARFCIEAFVTSQGMEDSKGRGRSMHQEVRHHLGGKGATWDAKAEVTLRGMSRLCSLARSRPRARLPESWRLEPLKSTKL